MKNTILAALVATVFGISAANAEGLYVGVGGEYVQSTAKHADSTGAGSLRVGTDINKFVAAELGVATAIANGNQHANTVTTVNAVVGYPLDMAGMKMKDMVGDENFMRAEDHQLHSPLYEAVFTKDAKLDAEKTGLGWKTVSMSEAKELIQPTTCKMKRPS